MDEDFYNYKQCIRKFATYDILEHYSKEAVDVYENTEYGVKLVNVPIYNKKTGDKLFTHEFHIAQICLNCVFIQ